MGPGGGPAEEVPVSGLAAPVRFRMPAAPVPAGSGAVCAFWDARAGAFSTNGCAALPAPIPAGHSVRWLDAPLSQGALAALAQRKSYADPSICEATPDAAMISFLNATGPAAAARQLGVSWAIAGPLACGCSVTVLDCAEENAKATAAAAVARARGGDPAAVEAAAFDARRRVYPSPRFALLVPAVSCPAGDVSTVMTIFYGAPCARAAPRCQRSAQREASLLVFCLPTALPPPVCCAGEKCALWKNGTGPDGLGSAPPSSAAQQPAAQARDGGLCYWSNAKQAFFGAACPPVNPANASVDCACLHLTDFSARAAPLLPPRPTIAS